MAQPRPGRPRARRGVPRDARAVSESLGSLLMIALTVIAGASLAVVVGNLPPPAREVQADLAVAVEKGAGGWGSGDESVVVEHRGGQALESAATTVIVRIGSATYAYAGDDLGSAFSDGRLRIGETWRRTYTITDDDLVDVDVLVSLGELTDLAATATVETPCSRDASPPVVSAWAQDPANVDEQATGPVTVTATLADGCAGVDEAVAPHLLWRLQDGTSPAYADQGAMSPAGAFRWQLDIPDPGWAAQGGTTLQYYVQGMRDERGNAGDSPVRSDLVEAEPVYVYGFEAATGSVENLPNAQSAADGGREANLTEGSSTGTTESLLYGSSTADSGATNPGNAIGAPDDAYATLPGHNNHVRVSGFPQQGGAITKVEIAVEAKYGGAWTDDKLRLSYLIGTQAGSASLEYAPNATDSVRYKDVTADRSWTWTDVGNLRVEAKFVKEPPEDGLDFLVDSLWARVTATETTQRMDIALNFSNVPAGAAHDLELRYRVEDDSFRVQVWNGSSWNTRGTQLTAPGPTDWTYGLTAPEWNGGDPRMRVLDDTASGGTPAKLRLDWGRVRTT